MSDIRRLGKADRPQWLALRAQLFPDLTAAALDAEVENLLGDPLEAAFGAADDGRLVGFVEVSERPWGEGCDTSPVGWIEAILVAPDHLRRGIGRQLVEAAAGWSRSRGLRELGSDAEIDNQTSIAAHMGWGFQETLRVVMFRRTL